MQVHCRRGDYRLWQYRRADRKLVPSTLPAAAAAPDSWRQKQNHDDNERANITGTYCTTIGKPESQHESQFRVTGNRAELGHTLTSRVEFPTWLIRTAASIFDCATMARFTDGY
jgi:hypothetical protein